MLHRSVAVMLAQVIDLRHVAADRWKEVAEEYADEHCWTVTDRHRTPDAARTWRHRHAYSSWPPTTPPARSIEPQRHRRKERAEPPGRSLGTAGQGGRRTRGTAPRKRCLRVIAQCSGKACANSSPPAAAARAKVPATSDVSTAIARHARALAAPAIREALRSSHLKDLTRRIRRPPSGVNRTGSGVCFERDSLGAIGITPRDH